MPLWMERVPKRDSVASFPVFRARRFAYRRAPFKLRAKSQMDEAGVCMPRLFEPLLDMMSSENWKT